MNNLIVRGKILFLMIFSCFYTQVQGQDYSYSTREFNLKSSRTLESSETEIEFEDLSETLLPEGQSDADDSFMIKFEVDASKDSNYRVLTFYYGLSEILRVLVQDGTFLVQRLASVADTDFYIDYKIFDPMFPTTDTFPYTVKMYVSKNLLWFESDKTGGDERIYHSAILWGLNDFVKDNRGSSIDYVDEFLSQTENAKIKIENVDSGSQLGIYTYKHSELLDDLNNGFSQVPPGWQRVAEDISGTYYLINSEGKCLAEHGPNEKTLVRAIDEDDYSACTVFELEQKVANTAQYTLEGSSYFLEPKTKNFFTSTNSFVFGIYNQISDPDKYRFSKLVEPYTLVSAAPNVEDQIERAPVSSSASHSGVIHKALFMNPDLYVKVATGTAILIGGPALAVATGAGITYLVTTRARSLGEANDEGGDYELVPQNDSDSGSDSGNEGEGAEGEAETDMLLPKEAVRINKQNPYDENTLEGIEDQIRREQKEILRNAEMRRSCNDSSPDDLVNYESIDGN